MQHRSRHPHGQSVVRRGGALWMTLLLTCVLGFLSTGAPVARADDAPTVQLNAPRPSAEVAGTVEVIFSVRDVGGARLSGATASIGSVSSTQSVDPAWCPIACSLSTVLDIGDLPDGPAEVKVVLELVGGRHQSTVFPVTVRNGPTVYLPYETDIGLLAADRTARVRVYAEPHDDAQIATVTWRDIRGTVDFTPLIDPSDLSGANWQAMVDTADLAEGTHTGTVVATDDAGRLSQPVTVSFTVVRTVVLTMVKPWGSAVDDLVLQQFEIAYRYAPAVSHAFPVHAAVVVDGTTVAIDRTLVLRDVAASANAGIAMIETSYRLPRGSHRVSIILTDNRGLTRTQTYDVTVVATVAASWTRGAGAVVVSGQLHALTASVRTAGVDLLDCRVVVEGRREDQPASCVRQPDGNWRADAQVQLYLDGPQIVRLRLTPSRGTVTTLSTTLTVVPKATATITEAAATAGRRYTMVGTVRSTGRHLRGVVVELQTRSSTKSPWTTVTTSTSAADGRVTFSVISPRSADYRLVTKSKTGAWGGAAGPVRFVKVKSTLTVTSQPTSVRKGKAFVVGAQTKPADQGAMITLQRYIPAYRMWVDLRTNRTTNGGAVRFEHKPGITSSYRLVRATTTTTWGTTGAAFSIKVTK